MFNPKTQIINVKIDYISMRLMEHKKTIMILSIILVAFIAFPVVFAQTPYTVSVEPETGEASPDDLKEYIITIEADPGFTDFVYVDLEIIALTYNETYNIGTAEPPYPAELIYTFPVPEDVPGDVTAYGTISAYSGDHVVEEQVTLNIKSGGILGSIIGWVLSVLNSIRNFFS
jgi:hypothetical protein